MRGSVMGSGITHLAVIAALFVARPPVSVIVPGPDVVQVALVEPTAAATLASPPPPEAPKPEPVTVQPTEDTGVKLAPPPKRKPAPAPPKQAPAPEGTTLPLAAVGNAGLRGQVSVDTNFEFTYYLTLVRNRIAQGWAPPSGLASAQPVKAVVYFRVSRGGEVSAMRLESGSGYEFFDRSAVRAVQLADPLPPLPLGYTGADLGVHFGFEFVAP